MGATTKRFRPQEEEQPPRKRIIWQDPDEYLRDHPVPDLRLSTPFPFLNDAFGGGLWPIMLFTIQGAPGAGKSSLGIQIAAHASLAHGSKVYVFATDEGTRAACVRLGQYAGIERDLLELTRSEGMDALRSAYGHGQINTVEADAPEAVLETFIDQISEEHRPGTPPPILYADSIQTLRTDIDHTFEAKRFQIAYVMEAARIATRALPLIIVFVSHVNRPAFAAKREEDRIDPLAAAAEAAEITRASDALLDLSGDIHEPQGVKAWLRKNRLHRGEKVRTRLRYDIPKGNFIEIDKAELAKFEEEQVDGNSKARSEKAEKKRQSELEKRVKRIVAIVTRRPGKLTKTKIATEIGGRRTLTMELVDNLSDPAGPFEIRLDEETETYFPAKKGE